MKPNGNIAKLRCGYNLAMLEDLTLARLRGWSLKGGMAILDQGIFSGSNFIFNILLARWLTPLEFGAYALAFAFFLVLYQLHQSMITDPMGVIGPASYAGRLRGYLLAELKLHFMSTVPLGVLLFLVMVGTVAVARGDNALVVKDLGVLGAVLPMLLLPWFLRRAFYVLGYPAFSALGSVAYGLSLFAILLYLRRIEGLFSVTAIWAMGLAGLASGLMLFLKLAFDGGTKSMPRFSDVFTQNWRYARWLVAGAVLMVFAGQMQIFMTGKLLGVQAAGVVDVMQSFSQPMILTIGAVTAIATPSLSSDFSLKNTASLRRKVALVTMALLVASILFEGVLFVFRVFLERMLYGGKYAAYVDLIPIFGIVPVLLALYWGPAIGLQAAQRPQSVLIVSAVWLPMSVALTYILTTLWGLPGAALSAILGYVTIVIVIWILYRGWTRGAAGEM